MEEIQKYECIYNKFSREYKDKFKRLNCWTKIGENVHLNAAEAKKKYKNIRTAYGRYLKTKKSVPSGSGRDAVRLPARTFHKLLGNFSYFEQLFSFRATFCILSNLYLF